MIRFSNRNVRSINELWYQYGYYRKSCFSIAVTKKQKVPSTELYAKPYSDIPKVKGLPVLGTAAEWLFNIDKLHELSRRRLKEYGPIYRETIGLNNRSGEQVFTANVDDWENVCRGELRGNPPIRPNLWSMKAYNTKRGNSPAFIDLKGDDFLRIKKSVASLMVPKEIAEVIPMLSDVTEDLTKLLEANMKQDGSGVIENIRKFIHMWSFECGGSVVFRTRLGLLNPQNDDKENVKMFNASRLFFKNFFKLEVGLPHHKSLMTSVWREYENVLDEFNQLGKDYLKKHGEHITDKTANLTDIERESIALGVLTAAADTTAHTALWALIELSTNPDVQEKLHEEIMKVYDGGQLTYKHLQLPYLRGFLKEVFRVRPIIPFLNRLISEDLVLSGYFVPAGTAVNLMLGAYNEEDWFTEAHMFKPERWKRERKSASDTSLAGHSSFAVLPFGHGQRSCLGRRLAENELYLFIAKMIYKYKIHPVKEYDATFSLFITPEGEIDIRLEKRN